MTKLPIVWSEGMFISPQHFQQQERAFHHLSSELASFETGDNDFGFAAFEVDEIQLQIGKFCLAKARGLFSDRTPFELSEQLNLNVPVDTVDEIIHLAVPMSIMGNREIGEVHERYRYVRKRFALNDSNEDDNVIQDVELATLNPTLKVGSEDLSGFSSIECARIVEVSNNGEVILDPEFIPNAIKISGAQSLIKKVSDLMAYVRVRASNNSQRLLAKQSVLTDASLHRETRELTVFNRWLIHTARLMEEASCRPRDLYHQMLELEGEMLSIQGSLVEDYRGYSERARQALFKDLFERLIGMVSISTPKSVIRLDWDARLFEKRRLLLLDIDQVKNSLTVGTRPILAIQSDMAAREISTVFPLAAKLVDVNSIAEVVRHGLPGVPLEFLPIPPAELRSQSDITYFRLDTSHHYWQEFIKKGRQLAMHIDDRVTPMSASLFVLD